MQRHTEDTRRRLALLVDRLKGRVYPETRPLDSLLVSSQAVGRISYDEAQKLDFREAKLGEQFGPLWSTFWFRGNASLPDSWKGKQVDLIWIAHYCESLLWMNGKAVQSLNFTFGERAEAMLVQKAGARQKLEFQIELSCSTTYGAWPPEKPYRELSPYVLDRCEVAIFDAAAWKLYMDFVVLQQLEADIAAFGGASDKAFGAELLYELNRFANEYNLRDPQTWPQACQILESLLKHTNGTRAHQISSVGEGHLDIAWWWPLEETKRKIVRTAANQIRLMESFSEYRFVCSQAYLYEVLKERLPELYERVQAAVKRRQWITVGGSWVEPDCNMPSGESLVRQFLHGQRFFQQEFGSLSTECWLQDSFGYAAQLPQIMKMAGMERFVSQKLHWGHLKPRIRLFHWQGLDGTKVLAHYPPEFTFSNPLTVAAVNKVARQYSEDDRSPNSLMSFGWGDGGGGPNRFMVELVSRLANLQGVPKVKMRSPAEFFLDLERDLKARPPLVQVGEIHFSRHRGTFTSQSMTKSKMRAAERVLHDLEFLSAIASRLGVQAYPSQELTRLWKIVLRNQHHDILTGTSIAIVHETAVQELSAVEEEANDIKTKMLSGLASLRRAEPLVPVGSSPGKRISAISTAGNGNEPAADLAINTIGFSRREVAATVEGDLVIVEAPSYGQGSVHFHGADKAQVQAHEDRTTVIIENEKLRAEFAKTGLLLKLIHKETGRDALSAPGNQFQIFDDYPNDFDAWEIELFHQETMRNCPAASDCQLRTEPLRAEIRFVHKIGEKSSLEQTVRLDALSNRLEFHCHANWQEEHRLLKVSFPAAVNATVATYDTQFGAIERPTHFNTPEDQSRFEVVGHKWADLSEHGFGMALLSDCKYGFSVQENQMRLSLLRAPKSPDPNCDLGEHAFSYALMPHSSRWQDGGVVAEAYKFNYPLLWATPVGVSEEIQAPHSFISVDDPNLVIETLKKAEDSDGLIIRLYECHGARGAAKLSIELPFTSACRADLLEREGEAVAVKNGQIEVSYAPFQIMTLVIK